MKFWNIEEIVNKKITKSESFILALEEKLSDINDTYIYIKSVAKYYWIEAKIFFSPADVGNNLLLTPNEIKASREFWIIKTYDNFTYKRWWKDWCYNLLNEESILKASDNPVLHNDIKILIENVCGYKKENIEYLHKAILYKYHNINDFTIPAIVLYGHWWSWKWTLISLLSTIFGEENVLSNLWQRDLSWWFDTYKWQKLIVEFAEIATNNTHSDIWILNKLKNIIWAEKITINEKWVKQYQTENIAWFFITSNSNKPLQLDDKDKGNRRFSIIKSISKLGNWKSINETIKNKRVISNYLAWLHETYPEVISYKSLEALDNEDKNDLIERSQSDANQFWEWIGDNFPDYIGKKKKSEIDDMISMFCNENNYEEKEFIKYFWHNSKYPKKKIRIWDDTYYWVEIPNQRWISLEDIKEIFQ